MFGFGKNTFLGIDIGTSSIKIVEIKLKGNKPALANYAWVGFDELPNERKTVIGDNLPGYIKKILKEARIESKNAYISLPSAGALITLVEFPNMVPEDLNQAIRYEAHKYIPTSLDEVVLSWDIVSKKAEQKKFNLAGEGKSENPSADKIRVILVAAPKSKIAKYEALVKDCGLELKSMEIESFSLARSLVGNDQGNFLIVDVGARICNIILVEKGVIKINRNIDAGGRDITKVIAQSLEVNEQRAETLKISNKEFLTSESNMSIPALEVIVSEIKRVLNDYYKSETQNQLDGLILSGGTGNLMGIENYFQKALNIRTSIGNPFGRIEYDRKLEPMLAKIKPRFSVAIGLALKGVEEELSK